MNACPLCLSDEKSIDHLLQNYRVAHCFWNSILRWFGVSWVLPKSITELFKVWKFPISHRQGKEMRCASFPAILWILWKERNTRLFEGKETRVECLLDKLKYKVVS